MNNLDIVLALFTTPNHRFSRLDTTAAFQATTSACNFKLPGSGELFPTIKPMSSTSKTVLNSYTINNVRRIIQFTTIHLKEFVLAVVVALSS